MQYTLAFGIENRLERAQKLLMAAFGPIAPTHRLDPVSQMVFAILSGRTRDEIARKAFEALANRMPDWEELVEMRPGQLMKLVAKTTFPEKKVRDLPAALKGIIVRRGRLDLDFLAVWPVEDARAWLEKLYGVGPKTSTAVLNLSTLHKRILVTDKAHARVARRIGLVPEDCSFDRTLNLLNRQLPDHWTADEAEEHHVLMQYLGKSICTHSHPGCSICPLGTLCPSPRKARP